MPAVINQERVRRWVEALRSGKYKQGHHLLHYKNDTDDREYFCCLGVACELAKADGVRLEISSANIEECTKFYYNDMDDVLPPPVMEWLGAGVSDPSVRFGDSDRITSLASANDCGSSFAEIADAIEKDWLKDA